MRRTLEYFELSEFVLNTKWIHESNKYVLNVKPEGVSCINTRLELIALILSIKYDRPISIEVSCR